MVNSISFLSIFLLMSLSTIVASAAKNEGVAPKVWDVNNPGFATKRIQIKIREGTWMSIDVSPSGKWVVFDLLDDIYRVPIEGGKAVPLTSSIAWDMQPQFSPDGQSIAFTSGQGSGDNIWVMDINGKQFEQVTNESFRMLNNPS